MLKGHLMLDSLNFDVTSKSMAIDPSTRPCFANARFDAVLDFQYVESARKNSTSIHGETPNASEENQRGKGSVTNPKTVPKNDSSKPQASTL
jgi:hypothetical protein